MTGHGGDGFLKFQDAEEITNIELADAFEQMWVKRRYWFLYIIKVQRFFEKCSIVDSAKIVLKFISLDIKHNDWPNIK